MPNPGIKAYHRQDPLMDERKAHYTPAQLGTFVKVQLMAGRQSKRGRFRSLPALRAMLPEAYAKQLPFLVEERDVVEQAPGGEVYLPGWDEWQEGDLTVGERMRRLRERQAQSPDERNRDRNDGRNGHRNGSVTSPSPAASVTTASPTANAKRDSLSGSTTSGVSVGDSPPSPPPSGGGRISPRAAGTNPRANGNRAQREAEREREAKAQRARRRQLARADGQISEAEYSELTRLDADPPSDRPRGYAYSQNGNGRPDVDAVWGPSTSKDVVEVSS